ncbi:hypothetical protein FRC18_002435 [Serendipita sp. 400]|nr:hypothetical protein FRC18_002435 [Serendipita sp. 400]
MFTLQTHQESQEYKSLEMRESTWEPGQPHQQPGQPDSGQESREDGSLYTDVQLGSNHQTESLPNREASTISDLYRVYPDVFNHPVAGYPAEISTLTRYNSLSTLYIDPALGFPTGTLQADGELEPQYRSPINDEFPPFEGYPNMNSPSTRGSGNLSISPAHTILQTAEHPETVGNEEEGQEEVVLRYSGGGTWRCSICAKSFRRRQRAVLHVLNKHNNIRLQCNGKCGAACWYVGDATHIMPSPPLPSLFPSLFAIM